MMSAEGPYVAAIIARMPDAAYNLAAYGVAFALAWLSESPIMMLLTASNTLVHDRSSFLAMRRFAYALVAMVTAFMIIAVSPPVFGYVTGTVMGLPPQVSALLRVAMPLLIHWPGAIGYRRFYQGLLVRRRMTRRVAYGTVIRLASMSLTAAILALSTPLHGVTIAACALSSGVLAEAIVSRWMARHVVAALLSEPAEAAPVPITQVSILRFYYPLAMTSMISMVTGPILTFFMGRSRMPLESLAALPVVQNLVFSFRSGGVAFQEVGVALSGRNHEHEREVGRAALFLAVVSSSALALMLFTPLANLWFHGVSGLSADLAGFALFPAQLLVVLPAMEYWLSFQRSRFILNRQTRFVTIATAIEVASLALVLAIGIGHFRMIGVVAGSAAMLAGRLSSNAFLFVARSMPPDPLLRDAPLHDRQHEMRSELG